MFYVLLESADAIQVEKVSYGTREEAEAHASICIKRGEKIWAQIKSQEQPIARAIICQSVCVSEISVGFVEQTT